MSAKAIIKLIGENAYRHDRWKVFSDFVQLSAFAISNAVDLTNRNARESEYMRTIGQYTKDEANRFPVMLAELVNGLEEGMADILGQVYMELNLGNKDRGQVFTPYPICQMSAKMIFDKPHIDSIIADKGYATLEEPASGSGAMVIAFAEAMKEAGINYQKHLHVTATDVDIKAVCMTYVQLSLLHIPAMVIHGNTLSLEKWSLWYTPAHIIEGWSLKLRTRENKPAGIPMEIETPEFIGELEMPEPLAAKKQATVQLTLF